MSPYNIDRDTRLQHQLLDTATGNNSLVYKLFNSLYAITASSLHVGQTVLFIALWAGAIYLSIKGIYLFVAWSTERIRRYARRNSLKQYQDLKDKEKAPAFEAIDLESQSPPPELVFTPGSIASPTGSPKLVSPTSMNEALVKSMKKLGIYVENSKAFLDDDVPTSNTRVISMGCSDYTFERDMIKAQ